MTPHAMTPIESRLPYISFTSPIRYYAFYIVYYQDRNTPPSVINVLLSPFQVGIRIQNSCVSVDIFFNGGESDKFEVDAVGTHIREKWLLIQSELRYLDTSLSGATLL